MLVMRKQPKGDTTGEISWTPSLINRISWRRCCLGGCWLQAWVLEPCFLRRKDSPWENKAVA
ncbi:hypothetical protein HPP92_028840 [Vanilla planifolia]|uniref:Uncharacterized protein n=1 Tax=Vanilla planifolia TaxID=51239 RepID=A0A835P3X0_VANPL|nr:hypothetical protein HPP92_028840 [Vanilla planifolia]KAG0446435.1 hypothetical protein HPP92_028829 [Vanilla planifolia]